jgi:hypothetical protein
MAKLTAWVVTILGILLLLPLLNINALGDVGGEIDVLDWLIAAGVLIVGIGKLVRNYRKRRK